MMRSLAIVGACAVALAATLLYDNMEFMYAHHHRFVQYVGADASRAVLDTRDYEWAATLREHTAAIRDEFLRYQHRGRRGTEEKRSLPLFGMLDPAQQALRSNRCTGGGSCGCECTGGTCPPCARIFRLDPLHGWRALWVRALGRDLPALRDFPVLASLLAGVPCRSAMFSVLAGRTHLNRHHGSTNLIWRYHLGLIVPPVQTASGEKLRLLVHDHVDQQRVHTLNWANGSDLLFDDTAAHAVENTTPHPRVVLFLDIERQDIPWHVVGGGHLFE